MISMRDIINDEMRSASTNSSSSSSTSSSATETNKFTVTQTGHSLEVGMPVYFDITEWKKAKADDSSTVGTHIVAGVTSTTITLVLYGTCTLSGKTFIAGTYYYTSTETAGELTSVQPTIGYSNPMLFSTDATTVVVLNVPAEAIVDQTVSKSYVHAVAMSTTMGCF